MACNCSCITTQNVCEPLDQSVFNKWEIRVCLALVPLVSILCCIETFFSIYLFFSCPVLHLFPMCEHFFCMFQLRRGQNPSCCSINKIQTFEFCLSFEAIPCIRGSFNHSFPQHIERKNEDKASLDESTAKLGQSTTPPKSTTKYANGNWICYVKQVNVYWNAIKGHSKTKRNKHHRKSKCSWGHTFGWQEKWTLYRMECP